MLATSVRDWPDFDEIPCIFPEIREFGAPRHVRRSLKSSMAAKLPHSRHSVWRFERISGPPVASVMSSLPARQNLTVEWFR
jgi:hypothetical protein